MLFNLFRLIAIRSLIIWLPVRIIFTWLIIAAQLGSGFSFSVSAQIIIVLAILYMVDMARRRERLLFANLGLGRRYVVSTVVLITACAEILLSMSLAMVMR